MMDRIKTGRALKPTVIEVGIGHLADSVLSNSVVDQDFTGSVGII